MASLSATAISCTGISRGHYQRVEVARIDWLLLKRPNLFEEEGQCTDDGKTDGSDEDKFVEHRSSLFLRLVYDGCTDFVAVVTKGRRPRHGLRG